MAAGADRPEDRPVSDLCCVQPSSERHYGAHDFAGDDGNDGAVTFLVGLGAADGYAQPVSDLFDVGDIQGDQFGTPEGTGEAEQQQRTIAQRNQRAIRPRRHGDDVLRRRQRHAPWHHAMGAPDAAHHGLHPLVGGWARQAAAIVHVADRGTAPADGLAPRFASKAR